DLEPNGIVDVNPFWVHTERGQFDARYRLNRATNTSEYWALAKNFDVRTPDHPSFISKELPTIPPLSAKLDSLAIAVGGPSGQNLAIGGAVHAHDAKISGVQIDRLSARFAGAISGAAIDRIAASGPWGSLDGSGEFSTAAFLARGKYRGTLDGLRPFLSNI